MNEFNESPAAAHQTPPLCADLASKKQRMSGRIAFVPEDVLDAAAHCWCSRTYKVLGPDRDVAHPENCNRTRECYRAPGQPRA